MINIVKVKIRSLTVRVLIIEALTIKSLETHTIDLSRYLPEFPKDQYTRCYANKQRTTANLCPQLSP